MQTGVVAQGHVALFKHHNENSKFKQLKNAEMVGLGPLPNDHRFWHAQNNSFLPKSSGHQDWCGRPILQHLPRFSITKASWVDLLLDNSVNLLEKATDSFPIIFRLGMLPNWKGVIEMWDRLSQPLILSPLHLQIIICGDVPQTIL